MNDNDIIKAMEHCLVSGDCAVCMSKEARCLDLTKEAFDIINRQKAEIERLKKQREFRTVYMGYFPKLERDKAIKEFAERLCNGRVSNDPVVIAVNCALEEMAEGNAEL